MRVFSQSTPSGFPQAPLHTWEDSGARISTIISAATPDQRLLGICEATRQSYALNANTGFQTGLSPWTVAGGTAVQSTTQTYEGGFAAQITPSGSASQVTLTSELLPCMPGQSVTVSGWAWFTSAVTSEYGICVNWYTLAGSYISTSSPTFASAGPATWTFQSNAFTAPATAYQFQIVPLLGGTPASAQVWYVDTIHARYTYTGPQVATVTEVEYANAAPSPWPITGTTQLS